MAKAKKSFNLKHAVIGALLAIAFITLLISSFVIFFSNRFYPGVYISDLNLLGQTYPQARDSLDKLLLKRTGKKVEFSYQGNSYSLDLSSLYKSSDEDALLKEAFAFGHSKFYLEDTHLKLFLNLNDDINSQVSKIASNINQPPIEAQINVAGSEISVSPSQAGTVLDEEKLKEGLLEYLNNGSDLSTELPIKASYPKLSYEDGLAIKKELDQIKLSPILLTFKDQSFSLDLPTLLNLIDLTSATSVLASGNILNSQFSISSINFNGKSMSDTKISLDKTRLEDYLTGLSQSINRDVKEPLFSFDDKASGGAGRVTEFQPPQEGYKLDIQKASELISSRLASADVEPIELPVEIIEPKNKLVNDLGIKELIGEGISHFAHSIPNRVFNVELAASRINGTLIPPGGIFSYNAAVGEVSAATGFKQGYVIKSGKTVLDDGGGVCQDSTTLFRAALNAGLPIVERTAHAYRVGYYEQDSPPGLDATVFAPSVDFKFKNDTQTHILVQATVVNDNTLIMDLYGTSDGRISKVSTPIITSSSPPLPDVQQDDPTLPKGEIKQVDFSAPGANVVFSRLVTSKDGKVLINETFHSNFRPWANVYLVGTQGT